MRAVLRNPAGRVALLSGLSALSVEGLFYFDRGRHATQGELAIAALGMGLLSGVLEVAFPGERNWNLRHFTQLAGLNRIFNILQKHDDGRGTLVGSTIVVLIVGALMGASFDVYEEYRRRKKDGTTADTSD